MMTYTFISIAAVFSVLSAPSEAFSHSSPLKVSATQRLKSDLMYRKISQIDEKEAASTVLPTAIAEPNTVKVAAPKKTKHLMKIDFKKDLSKYLDVTLPYYSLENENAIVDGTTGECRGIICTVKNEAPIGRERGEISFFDYLRAAGCISSAAAVLINPAKKRYHYPSEEYSVDVNPARGKWLIEELSSIVNGEAFLEKASDPVFLVMCANMSKRSGTFCGALKTNDTVWYITAKFYIISAPLFKRKFPPLSTPSSSLYTSTNPYESLSSKVQSIKTYSSFDKDWVCVEGTLPQVTFEDCSGHFHDNPCLAHSVMIFHTCDLLGTAIEKLTGVHIPFKKSDFGKDYGLRPMSFDCTPQTLHFPNTGGLKFQVKAYCSSGEMGKPKSIYTVEVRAIQDVTELVCFKATGRFVLIPPVALASSLRL